MNAVERQKYGATFAFLNRVIEREEPKNNSDYGTQISDATKFLGEVVRGLEDIASSNNGILTLWGDSREIEIAKEVLGLYGYDFTKLPGDKIGNIAQYFREKAKALTELGIDPRRTYKSVPKKQGLLNVCEKLMMLGNGNHQVLGEAKESVER